MKEKKSRHVCLPKWVRLTAIYLTSLILLMLAIFAIGEIAFAQKIYPRVHVANVSVGGLSPAAAAEKLAKELPKQPPSPAILTSDDGRSFTIKPEEVGASYDLDQSVASAFAVGRSRDLLANLTQKITAPLLGIDLPAKVKLDEIKLDIALAAIAKAVNITTEDAALVIKQGKVTISPAVVGKSIKTEVVKKQVLDQLGTGESKPIHLSLEVKEPQIHEAGLEQAKKQAEAVLANPIILTYRQESFTASAETIGNWLATKPIKTVFRPHLELYFDEAKVDSYIASLAQKIDLEPANAKLAISGGGLTIIESSREGKALRREVAKADLIRLLTIRKELPAFATIEPSASALKTESPALATSSPTIAENQIVLEVEIKKPDVTNDNINSLGIKERIAIATTDFKGSPPNRGENIKLGTKLFNGIILKSGAQFSAVKSLGRIDATSGFKPDLVIKQDQLIPEIGGGLCQVSTTLFRSVMNAGLQIDERRNHRFRVRYYEARPSKVDPEDYVTLAAKQLVGLDATIYDPSPDLKFTNDTGNYILIQGKTEGTLVTFEIFGTKDGRRTIIDGPYTTGTTPAPTEIQYIDDPTLPTGETKVKERPVAGAKTYFTYIVEKDGKQLHKNTFGSSYVPWQAKSYRGTGPATSPSPVVSPTPEVSPPPAGGQPSPSPSVQGASTETPPVPSPSPSV